MGWRAQHYQRWIWILQSPPYPNYSTLTAFFLHSPDSLQDQRPARHFVHFHWSGHTRNILFKSQVLKLPCWNQLSIFSTFNSQLLVIFSFFCVGSHGNKSVGRESVTLLLAFCTVQNPSSDPQASVIQKGSKSTVP